MDWKKIGKKLLFPPIWLMIVLTALSAVLLVQIFVRSWEETVAAYICYALAFYTLTVVTVFCVKVLPKQYRQIQERLHKNPVTHRLLTDREFRSTASLYLSLVISLLYIGIHVWSYFAMQSWWFVVLAVYYGIMALMRFLLVGYIRKNEIGSSRYKEWKRARICAYILLLVNLCLSGAVLMILYRNKGYDYPGVMIYVMAMYTFYSTVHAIVELVKYRWVESPVMSTAKIVSLSAALVSMLNLETAMFAQFGGEMSVQDQRLFIILTGAGVSIAVVTLSVLLIVKATKEIRRNNDGESREL